ncbi:sensor histidine kinase [Mucilaginibacter paludis]|uniref:histidine kinase n=1 Tax=Mucilaginibacter paludis DSM 18603 TaxID=714943 RepID=H1Y2G6_9SPHI|nr:HAMP domain-containing sensor histidine kinase [Mucilaginibacter paludis]EHQ28014.1 histidine kinase [Mucilaginibacter paludis DSM 18603]
MDHNSEISQNAQRLRYEAFSRFATSLNKCTSYHDIDKVLSSQLKFIINLFIFRVYYQNASSCIAVQGFIGQDFFIQQDGDIIYSFEELALANGIPVSYPVNEIFSDPLFADTIFTHQKVFSIVTIPVIYTAEHRIVMTIATTEDKQLAKQDYKFIQLINDLLANKLSQLMGLEAIAKSNKILETNNKQITRLNQYLDATVKKRTQELMDANTELKTLLYRTTHDFRAPLANIMGLSNLGKTITDDPEILLLFEHSKKVADGMDKMITKLNAAILVDDENNKQQPIDFVGIVAGIKDKYSEQLRAWNGNILVTCQVAETYYSYQNILTVILDNLADNSLNFKSPEKAPEITIDIFTDTDYLIIIFSDNGQGIDALTLPQIFDMYYRGNATSDGHGLGLYIVLKLIKSLKGDITVKSALNEYTTFTIKLPLH